VTATTERNSVVETAIIPFTYGDHQVRAVEKNGKILFCGRDVAKVLGYKDAVNALKQHCRGVANHHPIRDRAGRVQVARFITEGDLYRLISHSRLPEEEKFEAWVFDDVLPSIRKRGGYLTPEAAEKALTDPDFIIRLATSLKEERARRQAAEAQIEADAPHTRFGRTISGTDGDLLVKQVADLITQGGCPISQVTLFKWLRAHGWLCANQGRLWNAPTKWALEQGYVRSTVLVISTSHGDQEKTTPSITTVGQEDLIDGWLTGRYTEDK